MTAQGSPRFSHGEEWAYLSATSDVSDKEAKAARLDRYAELQWSLDTSPKAFSQGYLTSPTQEVYRLADEVWNPVK